MITDSDRGEAADAVRAAQGHVPEVVWEGDGAQYQSPDPIFAPQELHEKGCRGFASAPLQLHQF
jgi:hypothetical protein